MGKLSWADALESVHLNKKSHWNVRFTVLHVFFSFSFFGWNSCIKLISYWLQYRVTSELIWERKEFHSSQTVYKSKNWQLQRAASDTVNPQNESWVFSCSLVTPSSHWKRVKRVSVIAVTGNRLGKYLNPPEGGASYQWAGCCQKFGKDKTWCDLTRFLVTDVDEESEDNEQRNKSRPPVDDKHHHTAQYGPREGHPHVVVLEAGAPPCVQTWTQWFLLEIILSQHISED